jgi:hypothetical protein
MFKFLKKKVKESSGFNINNIINSFKVENNASLNKRALKTEKFIKETIDKMIQFLNISIPIDVEVHYVEIEEFESKVSFGSFKSSFNFDTNSFGERIIIIKINKFVGLRELLDTISHEMLHVYQYENFPNIRTWSSQNKIDLFPYLIDKEITNVLLKAGYKSGDILTELDARVFSENMSIALIKSISLKRMKELTKELKRFSVFAEFELLCIKNGRKIDGADFITSDEKFHNQELRISLQKTLNVIERK